MYLSIFSKILSHHDKLCRTQKTMKIFLENYPPRPSRLRGSSPRPHSAKLLPLRVSQRNNPNPKPNSHPAISPVHQNLDYSKMYCPSRSSGTPLDALSSRVIPYPSINRSQQASLPVIISL